MSVYETFTDLAGPKAPLVSYLKLLVADREVGLALLVFVPYRVQAHILPVYRFSLAER